MIENTIKKLKEELNEIKLVELANNIGDIQGSLTELKIIIEDFFGMINNKKKCLYLKEKK